MLIGSSLKSWKAVAEEGPRNAGPTAALWTILFCAFTYTLFSIFSGLFPDAHFDPLSTKRLVAVCVGGCLHLAAIHSLHRTRDLCFSAQLLRIVFYTTSATLAVLLARILYSALVDSAEKGLRAADGRWILVWAGYFAASLLLAQLAVFTAPRNRFPNEENAGSLGKLERPVLWIEQNRQSKRVPIETVEWIKAERNYVCIYSDRGTGLLRTSLSALEERLAPFGFIRVHRSVLCQKTHIQTLRRKPGGALSVILTSGTDVPVGRHYVANLKNLIETGI